MRRRLAFVVVAVLVAACGGSDNSVTKPDSTLTTAAAPDRWSSTSPPSTDPPSASEPSTTPSTVPPSPQTTAADPTQPGPDGIVHLGAPDPALFPTLPPTEVDWASVGAGWLLIDHPSGHGGIVEPITQDQRALYLVSPDDVVYGVSALPTDGSSIAAVSDDGRRVLLELFDPVCADGCNCPAGEPVTVPSDEQDDRNRVELAFGFAVLDVATTSLRPVLDPVPVPVCDSHSFYRTVDFTADGLGIWVSETWYALEQHATRVRLSRVDIAGGAWTAIVDETVEVDMTAAFTRWSMSVVELDDGRIVTTTGAGTWLRSPDGAPVRQLAAPDTDCSLDAAWDLDHVVARCIVPIDEFPMAPDGPGEQCRTSGLWLLALDGSPARPLAVPFDERGYLSCWAGYTTAEPIGEALAVQVSGDGCSVWVDLISADGRVTPWRPETIDVCTELLLGVRNGSWLIEARPEGPGGAVFEVTGDRSFIVDLPSGEVFAL